MNQPVNPFNCVSFPMLQPNDAGSSMCSQVSLNPSRSGLSFYNCTREVYLQRSHNVNISTSSVAFSSDNSMVFHVDYPEVDEPQLLCYSGVGQNAKFYLIPMTNFTGSEGVAFKANTYCGHIGELIWSPHHGVLQNSSSVREFSLRK